MTTLSHLQKIHDHPINLSGSKALFSFPKAQRFAKISQNINPNFYETEA